MQRKQKSEPVTVVNFGNLKALPALLAKAKAEGDAQLVAAILKACSGR
jgi:hypothetical protein